MSVETQSLLENYTCDCYYNNNNNTPLVIKELYSNLIWDFNITITVAITIGISFYDHSEIYYRRHNNNQVCGIIISLCGGPGAVKWRGVAKWFSGCL